MYTKNDCNILGIALVGITRKFSSSTIKKIEDRLIAFIKDKIPRTFIQKFYYKPFFNTMVYVHNELSDLVFRPRRWELPLVRIISQNKDISDEVKNLVSEIENRVNSFQGLT
ncbi:hypothetical protein CM19_01155 [Candidatus Acidianus copahuensis]|uniref:Uncharacterized protein n=1 Tax=Candidatus Acidianus copahuensis TaxID=1160895 RepID=A0A031LVA6_9CREN|nr:hypothetical protein [Candidatus Acidianus copahuensis]EZQ11424.1 hypothetical protein CM19_01155 [Candidatus Acidianus copahuensis]